MNYEMFDTESKIHISAGLPCVSVLPFNNIIKIVSQDLKKENDSAFLQYGFTSGYFRFKKLLANFIGSKEKRIVNSKNLYVTNGATHGILFSIISLAKGRASVIMERPTYFPMIDLFKELNLNLHFANVDKDGISVGEIREHLKNISKNQTVFIHITPYFQNPTGVCISDDRAKEILEIVKDNINVWLLVDNVYKYLAFEEDAYNNPFSENMDRVINIGSFSKIFGPGLRLGWLETDERTIKIMEESGYAQSSGGFNPVVSRLVEKIIGSGKIDEIIETWIDFLKTKQKELTAEIKKSFPEANFYIPGGGYYIWTDLKNDLIANSEFRQFVKNKKDVIYVPGTKCAGDNDYCRTYLRLGFATYSDDRLIKGIRRLREAFEEFTI